MAKVLEYLAILCTASAVVALVVQGQQNGPPKILPIAAADSYPEASTVNLICTVSAGLRQSLSLSWTKDGESLDESRLANWREAALENLSIENTGDISILRIRNATHLNSGQYTCMAKNSLGEDSTSVNIVINVEMKWTKFAHDTEIGLNQDVTLECDAVGMPLPTISWNKHPRGGNTTGKATVLSQGKMLRIVKAQFKDSGVYECIAHNNVHQDLRRIIQVTVRAGLSTKNATSFLYNVIEQQQQQTRFEWIIDLISDAN